MTPDGNPENKRPVSKALREKLKAEARRTGVTALTLLKSLPDLPGGLTASAVNRWLSGLCRDAPDSHVRYVLDRWAALPDSGTRPKRGARFADGGRRIEVTEDMSALIRAEFARTALDYTTLLQGADDAPPGLNARILRGWLYRQSKTASEAYWNYAIARLRAAPDFTGRLPPLTRPRRKI